MMSLIPYSHSCLFWQWIHNVMSSNLRFGDGLSLNTPAVLPAVEEQTKHGLIKNVFISVIKSHKDENRVTTTKLILDSLSGQIQ